MTSGTGNKNALVALTTTGCNRPKESSQFSGRALYSSIDCKDLLNTMDVIWPLPHKPLKPAGRSLQAAFALLKKVSIEKAVVYQRV